MSSMTLKERMRARRERMKETTNRDVENIPLKSAADEDEASPRNDAVQAEDETKDSENLLSELRKRRRHAQKELSTALKGGQDEEKESVSELMRSARKKTRERIKDSTKKEKEETEVKAVEAEDEDMVSPLPVEQLQEEEEEGDGTMSSAMTTLKSGKGSLEVSGTTPRKFNMSGQNKTLRATLKERIKAAKDKGKDEAYDETRATGRRLKGLRNTTRSTRFDDASLMRKEDYEVEAQLEKSIAARSKWKGVMEQKMPYLPSPEEAYDFFTRIWEAEPEEETAAAAAVGAGPAEAGVGDDKEPGAKSEEPKKENEQEEGEEEKKKNKKKTDEEEEPLLEDFDDEAATAPWEFYQVGRAEYRPFHDKMQDESKIYFVPSMRPAPTSEKIFEQECPRFLEDEGFYVGTKPTVPLRNVSKMENRILKQRDSSQLWFGEDGRLITLPDPLKEVPSRPMIPEEPDPLLELEYNKAILKEFDIRLIDGSIEGAGRYQLDVDINTLTLSHHHLFSREHVLTARMTALYGQYAQRSKKKIATFLTDKLRALKGAAVHVQENITAIQLEEKPSVKALLDQESRLKEYREEIRTTRIQRDREMGADRSLLKNIIDTWKELKSLRQFQGFTNTSVKLKIHKENADKGTDEREWNAEMDEELAEIQEDAELVYKQRLEYFRAELDAWKKQSKQKKEAQKRQKKRDRRSAQEGVDSVDTVQEDVLQEEKDQEILNAPDLEKPEKPTLMDTAEERAKILARFNIIRRQPGEPRLFPDLSAGATISQTSLCPRGEQQRRNEVSRYKVFVKVLFNSKEVSRTPARPLGQDFTVRFAQIFNVQIVQWPESIKVQVFETAGLSSELLSEVYAVIPEVNVTSETAQLDDMEFSSDQRVSHHHEGVGSGVPISFTAENTNLLTLMTTGTLSLSVAWAVDEEGCVLVPPTATTHNQLYNAMKGMDAVAAIGASGMSDMDQLSKWITQSRLDPNDPSNADLMYLMKPVGGGDMVGSAFQLLDYFRLEQLQEEFDFTTDEELDKNRRFKAILYREKEVPEFRNYKLIPCNEKELQDDIFQEYEKKKRDQDKIRTRVMDSHRVAVAKFMQQVREQVMNRFRIAQHQKTLPDMVFEDAVPNIGTIIPNLLKITEPRRPLKPVRKERKKMTAQNLKQVDVKLLINIVRAFDIPVRSEALQGRMKQAPQQALGGTTSTEVLNRSFRQTSTTIKNIAGETLVRPFVEVTFQRNTQMTTIAEGPNPSWNEELQLAFRPPNEDYSPSNLQSVKESLYINLFDEYVVDVQQDDRERGTSIHRRIERRWLGSMKIPFSTIYFNSRIEGTFRIDKPPILLGYEHDPRNRNLDTGVDVGLGTSDQTYITLFITVEPQLTLAEPVREKFESNEDDKLLAAADKWVTDLEKRFRKRDFKTTVVDINGKSVFITRFFKPLAPPDSVAKKEESSKHAMEKVARFVSLIPFVSDSVVFPGMCDIWSTCDQFLQMLQGDEEEHAVLLVCYFLHLGKTAYLLLGSAIPEGPTAYVLTKEDRDYWIWNAATGEHFSYRDNYCPIQSIGCLVSADNIWANVQPNDQPSRVQFDLSNPSHWKPFFHKGFPHPGLSSVQPERLLYTEVDKEFVLDIQDKIERTLREKIMEWRPRHITRWNRHCIHAFRQLLPRLEENRGRGEVTQLTDMEQLIGSYKLCGFPINMPYTDVAPLVEAVYATGVHNTDTSDVEYALAVHVHPYPNSILSVWIYVASLVRKR